MFKKKIMLILFLFLVLIIILFYGFGMLLPSSPAYQEDINDQFLTVNGNKIRYKQINRNSKITLVFLHSFGGRLEMWDSLASYFTKENILLYDMIGFGKSDKPIIDYSLDTQSNYLIKVLDMLKIKSCILIGSSMGASTAAWAGAKFPDRFSKIILFAPSGYPGSMNHKFPGNYFYKPGILNKIGQAITSTSIFRLFFSNSLGFQSLSVTSSYDQKYIEALKNIKQPTLLFWSKGDNRSLFEYSKEYLKLIKDAKLITKPEEVGHGIPAYKTDELADEIKQFLYK